jgi:hypothetical protein
LDNFISRRGWVMPGGRSELAAGRSVATTYFGGSKTDLEQFDDHDEKYQIAER